MEQLTFQVPHMDCPAEEQLIRMQLAERTGIRRMEFDLPGRTLLITHSDDAALIERLLIELNLGAVLVGRTEVAAIEATDESDLQRRVLITVLVINAALFVIELITGLIAQSMGLIADSLDMLADAIVYGLSLYAVGRAASHKQQVAKISGYFQLCLGILGMAEVVRRFLGAGDEPGFMLMIGISLLALSGNAASLFVLQRARSQEVHMKASWIFTSNDVLVNIGVIIAGVLVFLTGSHLPDLVIGSVVFAMVCYGAFRILRMAR
ncbi:cobalt-zinc-cadmium resistance protein [Oscillochloris trichoides DG-6]|uniref:Cobalt-zinc-cadmium resistance protein n=1 Tax=Oscillochloris trichoides DG-6 TaxID=765420 RepID=E1IF20_9CHLR|nr:cation transporter [Oscillochloris trichoides]EFO80224.1 cobalt-zinc-cadmium resistance protein [Oscillochloris trichoides DG-6]